MREIEEERRFEKKLQRERLEIQMEIEREKQQKIKDRNEVQQMVQ